ncbi:MAG TPA: hypothetical protein EYP55_00240, partial [Anaerolineae bacterium]|nr:hypothetical protein [Anaerolineae bacterium]
LDARQLLLQPYAWDGLKRALRSREVRGFRRKKRPRPLALPELPPCT